MIKVSSAPVMVKPQGKKFSGNRNHLKILSDLLKAKGIKGWNLWADKSEGLGFDLKEIDLSKLNLAGINLSGIDLGGVDFRKTNLEGALIQNSNLWQARLQGANMQGVDLGYSKLSYALLDNKTNLNEAQFMKADLSMINAMGAKLRNANFSYADLSGADFRGADISGSIVTGASVWSIITDSKTRQNNLIIEEWIEPLLAYSSFDGKTKPIPVAQTNKIETAQILSLVVDKKKLSMVIGILTEKLVLILGNFSPQRKEILNSISSKLTEMKYIPVIFDFPPPDNRNLIDMVTLLASLSRFVIADLTQPRSTPLESLLITSELMIPFAPIIQKNEKPFGMFNALQRKYFWLLDLWKYQNKKHLLSQLKQNVINPCEKMWQKINGNK